MQNSEIRKEALKKAILQYLYAYQDLKIYSPTYLKKVVQYLYNNYGKTQPYSVALR